MKTILLILSAVFFHLPRSFMKDTMRRYGNMQKYRPEDAMMYEIHNGNIKSFLPLGTAGYVLALGIALIPLFKTIPLHWAWIVFINLLYMIFVSPWLGFLTYPRKEIFSKAKLTKVSIICTCIAIVLLIMGSLKLKWFVIVIVLAAFLLARWIFLYILELLKDNIELNKMPLEEKIKIIIQTVNADLLDGGGEIVKISNRDINLFNDNIPNILIHFIYRHGDLMIVFLYKYFQQEMEFKKVFYDIDDDIIHADQQLLANEFINEALIKKEEHENTVFQKIR